MFYKFSLKSLAFSLFAIFTPMCFASLSNQGEFLNAALDVRMSWLAEMNAITLTDVKYKGIFGSAYEAYVVPLTNDYIEARFRFYGGTTGLMNDEIDQQINLTQKAVQNRCCFFVTLVSTEGINIVHEKNWKAEVHQNSTKLQAQFYSTEEPIETHHNFLEKTYFTNNEVLLCTEKNERINFRKPFTLFLKPQYKKSLSPLVFYWNKKILDKANWLTDLVHYAIDNALVNLQEWNAKYPHASPAEKTMYKESIHTLIDYLVEIALNGKYDPDRDPKIKAKNCLKLLATKKEWLPFIRIAINNALLKVNGKQS